MPILKSYVFPHGSNILDPEHFPAYPTCQNLHDKALEAGKSLAQDQLDLIFLVTPHGHALSKSYCFYQNASGTGNIDDTPQYSSYKASLNIDVDQTKAIMTYLQKECPKIPLEGLCSYGDDMAIPLKWSEVIPSWLIFQCSPVKTPKFIIFSLPHRRLTEGDQMVEDAYMIGKVLYEYLNNLPERVGLVISCDLAHTHKINGGPEAGTEPYGTSVFAEPFDEAIEKWAQNPVEKEGMESLLIDAKGMLMKALSCGYLGLVMLAAGLRTHVLTGGKLTNEVLARYHPTYFGMMVAKFSFN